MDFGTFNEAFLEDDGFLARDAIFTPAGGVAAPLRVVFLVDPEDVGLGGAVSPGSSKITIGCRASDIPGCKQRDAVTVGGTAYLVQESPHVDETGWATVPLVKEL